MDMRSRGAGATFGLAAALVFVAILITGCGASAPAAAPGGPVPLVPASGVLFGARVSPEPALTRAERMALLTRLERDLGRTLDIHHHDYAWNQAFPADLENWDLAVGRITLISWNGTATASIVAGQFDGMIAQRADAVKRLGASVFLRCSWPGDGHFGPTWPGTPNRFVQAWRHAWRIFRERAATNAVWVWCAGAGGFPAAVRWNPGDEYAEWVCADGHNWGGPRWRSFATIFEPFYQWAGRKPLMGAETASVEQGGDKALWNADAASALKGRFPSIKAFGYVDVVGAHNGSSYDWRVNASARAYAADKAMAADPYFTPRPAPTR